MVSSARQAIACILLIFCAAVLVRSQVPAKNSTASISGKVTFKNKPLSGVVVVVREDNGSWERSRYRGTTDQAGNYRVNNIAAGTYQVGPIALALVLENELFPKSLVIDEGDAIEDVNFSMVRGGVITGKITDADGKPLIEQQVILIPVDVHSQTTYLEAGVITDDRGVYRAFGLREGKYKVSVGQSEHRLPGGARFYPQTFYPSVVDPAKATLVEVTEGSEADDIDITVGRPMTGFKVTGKIMDGETGKPLANVAYGVYRSVDHSGGASTSGSRSNANGEFKFEGVLPGKYSVFLESDPNMPFRAEWVPFEVVDRDISDLIIKTEKGASVSGVVVVEGIDSAAPALNLTKLSVVAMIERSGSAIRGGFFAPVKPDGSFRISGLQNGVVNFVFSSRENRQLSLVRVERDGVPQPTGITIKNSEEITGVRLIVKYLTGSIRGQVKVEDGELTANTRMSIWVRPVGDDRMGSRMSFTSGPQIDSRGRFVVEGLAAGVYEINISVSQGDFTDSTHIFKQQVTVADNTVSEVTVPVKVKP